MVSFTCCVSFWWSHDLIWPAICFNWIVWPRCFLVANCRSEKRRSEKQIKSPSNCWWKAILHLFISTWEARISSINDMNRHVYMIWYLVYHNSVIPGCWFWALKVAKLKTWRFSKHPDSDGCCQFFCILQYHQQTSFRIHILNKWQSVWKPVLFFKRKKTTSSTWKMLPETT